jgi:hypothetical protein
MHSCWTITSPKSSGRSQLNNVIGIGAAAGVVLLLVVSVLIGVRMMVERRMIAFGYE